MTLLFINFEINLVILDVTATPISSELCANQQESTIQECLWYNGQQRGCSIVPCQKIFLGPWIAFPTAPNLIPVNHGKGLSTFFDPTNELYLLIETEKMPNLNNDDNTLTVCIKCFLCLIYEFYIHFNFRWKIMGYQLLGKLTLGLLSC